MIPASGSIRGLQRIEFAEAAGRDEVEAILRQHPESRKPFYCLMANRYPYGIVGPPKVSYVPLRGEALEADLGALCELGIQLRQVYVPADWTEEDLDRHFNHWSAYCGVKPLEIEQWSTTHERRLGPRRNQCTVGGVCLMLTRQCDPPAFRDFNLAPPQATPPQAGG